MQIYAHSIKEEMIFRELGGIWRRVDSQEPQPPTLADILNTINIIVDNDTQFCRIVRYYTNIKRIIVYRAYYGKITITIHDIPYKE